MNRDYIDWLETLPPACALTTADAAAAVGIKAPCLRKWYRDRRAEEFIETLVRENLNVANNLLTSAAPRLADELIQIALDPKMKAYA